MMKNAFQSHSNPKITSSRGFSLVEVMIALVILMMVLFIGNLAYRTYSTYWHKELGDFEQQVSELKGITNVHSIIRNIKPMVFRGGKLGGYVYFEGGDSIIRAIANEAISVTGSAAAFEVQVVNNNSDGVDVIYREFPIVDTAVIEEAQIGEYGQSINLLTGVEDVRFEYFGWKSYDDFAAFERSDNTISLSDKIWFGLYSGKDTLISPEAVKMRIKQNGIWSELVIPLSHFVHDDLTQFVGADL